MDIDLATGHRLLLERCVVIAAAAGVVPYPGFLFLLLFAVTHFVRAWSPHQHLIIRCSLRFMSAWLGFLLANYAHNVDTMTVPALFLLLVIVGSHYLVAGFAKLRLAPHVHPWIWHHRFQYLAISAYMWG
ncbi:MAG: hypothetical protein VX346_27205 [Planctomycetota bacterium]|nr:hypothetical protein [Planctomycetota bacterium]